jgi:hypothetical protein
MPLPSEETTPPVMNMNRVMGTNLWNESAVGGKPSSAVVDNCDRASIEGRAVGY